MHFAFRVLFTVGLSLGACLAFLSGVEYLDIRDQCAGAYCTKALNYLLVAGSAAGLAAVASLVGLICLAVRPVSPR